MTDLPPDAGGSTPADATAFGGSTPAGGSAATGGSTPTGGSTTATGGSTPAGGSSTTAVGDPTPTGGGTATATAQQPWSPPTRYRRSREDRLLAGVCGGVARSLGIDPIVLRVAVAVLTFFGGAGIVVYVAGWLLMPDDADDQSLAQRAFGRRIGGNRANWLLAGLLIVAVGITLHAVFGDHYGPWHPAVVLLVIAAILFARKRARSGGTWPHQPPPAAAWPAGPAPVPPASTPGTPADPTRSSAWEAAPTSTTWASQTTPTPAAYSTSTPAGYSTSTGWDSAPAGPSAPTDPSAAGSASGSAATPGPTWNPTTATSTDPASAWNPTTPLPPGGPMPPVGFTPPPRPPRRRSRLGASTFFVVLFALGLLAAIDALGADVPLPAYPAVVVAGAGLGLLIGTWYGRARGLILLGLLGLLALPPTAFAEEFHGGFVHGTRTIAPTNVADLAPTYEFRGGEVRLDLSKLDLAGQNASSTVRLGAGELIVTVPPTTDVTVHTRISAGQYETFDDEDGGIDLSHTVLDVGPDGPGGGTLDLTIRQGVGHLEVRRADATVPTVPQSPATTDTTTGNPTDTNPTPSSSPAADATTSPENTDDAA